MTNVDAFEALGDPTRRKLFERLRQGPCSVSELVASVPVSQPAVSQHLRVLKDARLVQVDRQGQQRIYSLNPEGLSELRAYVEEMWEGVLGAYQKAAESAVTEEETMNHAKIAQEVLPPVRKSLLVEMPVEAAFHLFTEGMGRWWPLLSHSVGEEKADTCILEGRAGGRIYEVLHDRSEYDWGRVLSWEPPRRLVFTWYPGREPDSAQQVEVSFRPEGGKTRLDLVHTGWEQSGERAQKMRDGYVTGWDYVLGKYVEMASATQG